ncbi:MAG: endonuclease/exonuclease/phosphatase family protein [Chitinispirillales bacterium]|nr:endonuclease/exonuclease/phosphatase family protein [Chitinispirillales bacterium]
MNRRISRSLPLALSLAVSLSLASTLLFCNRDSQDRPDGKAAAGATAAVKDPPLPDTITVGAYNVENLFDFVLDGTEYDEYKPGWFGWTEEVQKTKLRNVAQVVAALGADIVGLSEVENLNVIRELQGELDRMGAPYPHGVAGSVMGTAVQNAILSRFPIVEKIEHQVPIERARTILEARIARGGDELRVFANHWPSKRHPESTRLAAAEVLRQRLDSLPPDSDYIILGDLNSNYDEFATFHTAGFNNTGGRTGVNHVLKTVIEGASPQLPARFVCKRDMDTCAGCHYNLWLDLPEDKRMSYIFRGAMQTIDHIILPRSMLGNTGYTYLGGSFTAFTMDDQLMRDGVPYRWQMVFRGQQRYHLGRGFSDHLPIKARFVRASILSDGDTASRLDFCPDIDPQLRHGDFAATTDGWVSGDSRFTVSRDDRFARTGTHSLRVAGMHETENRTAAKVRLQTHGAAKRHLTLSIRGSGSVSIRIRRPTYKWVNFNAPDFTLSRSARYRPWRSSQWVNLRLPLPEGPSGEDVEVEIRSGKGERLLVWVDRVRLE